MTTVTIPWTSVESRRSLYADLRGEDIKACLETDDSNTWGYFRLPNEKAIAVGYANLGLIPAATLFESHIFVGIDELLVSYNFETFVQEFVYRMPSVFHEFVSFSDQLIVRDEIGFVSLSLSGAERWKTLVHGPICEFTIKGNSIDGNTIDGERFSFSLSK